MSDKINTPIKYLYISYTRLITCTLATFGFYEIYWLYNNWVAINNATEQKIRPFWRTVFSIFWVYGLFKQLEASAKAAGYRPKVSAKLLAVAYIVACIVSLISCISISSPRVVLALGLFALATDVWLLVMVQKGINHYSGVNTQIPHKTTKGEIAIIVTGIIICVSNIIVAIQPSDAKFTPRQQALYEKYNTLTADYDSCSTSLEMRRGALDSSNQSSSLAFAKDEKGCEAIRVQQNKATDEYSASLDD